MAWLWKQGRPTLLAVVGAGVLGYKAFHRDERQWDTDMERWECGRSQRTPLRTTRTSAPTPAQRGWLGGPSVK